MAIYDSNIAWSVTLELPRNGAVMTIQSPCNLAYTELEQLQMVDPEALFKCKLNIGHGGSLLVREKVHSSHYQTPSVSYSPLGGAVRT